MFEREDIEEIILGMADLVRENHRLRADIEDARLYEKKYHDLVDQNVKAANESSASLLAAIMNGAFTTK